MPYANFDIRISNFMTDPVNETRGMKGLLSIICLHFKEATRDKIFAGVVFFFIFYLAFCVLLGELSWGHSDKVLRNAGLVGMELTTILLMVFSFTFGFFRDQQTRILEVYLVNVPRAAYLAGKLLAYCLIAFFYLFFSALVFSVILYWRDAFHPLALVALYPMFLKITIVIGITSIFSCLLSSALLALLSTLFVYLAAELGASALKIVGATGDPIRKACLEFLYSFLPNMDKLDIKSLAVHDQLPSLEYFAWMTVYAGVYILFLWLINIFIFQRKEY